MYALLQAGIRATSGKNKHLIYSCMQKCFCWRLNYIIWMVYKQRNNKSPCFDLKKNIYICEKETLESNGLKSSWKTNTAAEVVEGSFVSQVRPHGKTERSDRTQQGQETSRAATPSSRVSKTGGTQSHPSTAQRGQVGNATSVVEKQHFFSRSKVTQLHTRL